MPGPLSHIRVLDLSRVLAGPWCTQTLADLGADVIKVEHPVRGDPIRGLVTAGIVPGAKGVNFFTEQLGRNKRSVGVDLATDAGREILYRMVESADIFLTNYLPEAREKLKNRTFCPGLRHTSSGFALSKASVVLPVPGGPHNKIEENSRSDSIARRKSRPGPTRSSCPTYSSSERARIRAASGWLRAIIACAA